MLIALSESLVACSCDNLQELEIWYCVCLGKMFWTDKYCAQTEQHCEFLDAGFIFLCGDCSILLLLGNSGLYLSRLKQILKSCIILFLWIILAVLFTFSAGSLTSFFSPQMLSSKDVNFVGYTYKNFEIVNDHNIAGIGWWSLLCPF